uniref:C2H2-type domain-containing protein n=1 Tax=Anopheles atroparvus TaxID=41427 RepID=A0A182JJ42_ANOAO
MDVPSMVRRSGDKLIVRQVVSDQQEVLAECVKAEVKIEPLPQPLDGDDRLLQTSAPVTASVQPHKQDSWKVNGRGRDQLPQCKVKRNYSCPSCAYGTQNPRRYLTHLRDTHGEKISINACQRCLYASKHHQKLVRHMRMVHGTEDTGSRRTVKREAFGQSKYSTDTDSQAEPSSLGQLTPSELETATAYGQQLVASDIQRLWKQIENSWNSSIAVRPEKELLKPVPMSLLMPEESNTSECQQHSSDGQPPNGTTADHDTPMKCNFCELSYGTTVDLANHIEAAHKEDLFTSLLQKSIDESQQNLFPQSDTDSASNDLWKSMLDVNYGGSDGATKSGPNELDGNKQTAQSITDDDDVEILESSRNETYCGIETAPGYGEVTSKLPTTETSAPNAVTKKVFKCPHCSFWASTASRFHVHIVGHLNKKPFECSLCSYRSNWRWDITKHIRLKTIRDPSHKNAGVLMNDETGRRNYTKYNKYITLMQIADNSAKDSAALARTAENTVADLLAACNTYNIDLKAFANIPGYKTLLANKQIGDETQTNTATASDSKQHGAFHLKCQVCEFRTSSNEELLVHATNTHAGPTIVQLDDVIETQPSGGAPTVESNALQLGNCTVVNIVSGATPAPANSVVLTSLSKSAANTSSESSTNGTLLLTTGGAGDRNNATEAQGPGEGEGGSQRMAVPTWRHNAPYRCGHCHQVSNWKHRHCRLKHNGNVLIEHINSEKDDPSDGEGQGAQRNTKHNQHSVFVVDDGQYLIAASARQSTESLVATTNPPPLAPFTCDELGYPVGNTLEPIVEILDKDPADFLGSSSTVLVSSGTVAPAVPGEQLDCVSCQFHAETVEQLTEHLEAHISNGQREGSYNIAPTTLLDPVPTVMFYCSKCPARFFDRCHVVEHEQRHTPGGEGTACPVCTYTIPSGDEPSRHLEVHSAAYNKNTENLQIFLAESKDYPKPRLTMHEGADQTTEVWCVERAPMEEEPSHGKVMPPVDTTSTSPKRAKRSKQQEPRRSVDTASVGTDQPPLRSIFLCEYCDNAFDAESDLNAHVRSHFSAILAAQNVAYYASLNNALHKEKTLELVVTGAQSTLPLHYVYDNTRSKQWAPFSKADSVLLKL